MMPWRYVARNIHFRSHISFFKNSFTHFNPISRDYNTFAGNGSGCFRHSSLWRHPNDSFRKKTQAVLFSGTLGSKPTREGPHPRASGAHIRRQPQRTQALKSETQRNPRKPNDNGDTHDASKIRSKGQGAKQRPMMGRFNRIAAEKGLSFAAYLYILGESCTLFLTYCLHTNQLYVGEIGIWLSAIGLESVVKSYLDVGPIVFNTFRLSPLLLLNYLIANILTLPLISYQMSFCVITAPMLSKLVLPLRILLRRWKQSKADAIPKAPSPLSGG